MKYDLLIIGAGTAGCLAAKVAAERGLNVCLIDRKREEEIGDKVCGDAVGKHHFDNVGIAYPSKEELAGAIKGVRIYSPDRETIFEIKGEGVQGFTINRREFGQRLLREALDSGIDFFDNFSAVGPIVERKFVHGAVIKDLERGKKSKIRARIVIDSSGFSAVLRKKLSLTFGFEDISLEDVILCYREIRLLSSEVDPEFCEIYLSQKISPGGYYWIFPKGKNKVNVGLGVRGVEQLNPKQLFYEHVLTSPIFKNSKIVSKGGGVVSTRRPLDRLIANGFMIAGDAACMVNPIHGGGIGPSMMGGKLSAEAATRAIERGDVSEKALWQYAVDYMALYGAKQAALDIFRLFIQSLTDEELNFGMKHRLIKEEDVLTASLYGEAKISLTEKIVRLFKGIGRLYLIDKLKKTANAMREFKDLYLNYPSSEEFPAWKERVKKFYQSEKARIELS